MLHPLGWCGQNKKAISYMLHPSGWCGQNKKAISYMLHPLGWCGQNMKATYILHTSAVMYTFQNFITGVNDKV